MRSVYFNDNIQSQKEKDSEQKVSVWRKKTNELKSEIDIKNITYRSSHMSLPSKYSW